MFETLFGLIFTAIGSFASELIGPASYVTLGFKGVRFLSRTRCRIKTDKFYDGTWEQTWSVQSNNFARDNTNPMQLYRFMKRLAGEFSVTSTKGTTHSIRVVGDIQGNIVTGRWSDPEENAYYGAFQLIISPLGDRIEGKWIGFSSRSNIVRADKMIWRLLKQAS